MNLRPSKLLFLSAILATAFSLANAGVEVVELAKIQVVRTFAGTLLDPNGDPIRGATVDEVTSDMKTVIQTVQTDESGRFKFLTWTNVRTHHLLISHSGFNPLFVHVRVSRWSRKYLHLELHLAT